MLCTWEKFKELLFSIYAFARMRMDSVLSDFIWIGGISFIWNFKFSGTICFDTQAK